ncbi:hypothetical protein BKA67DRAFT_113265 [Truncatella angustata]|uniref:Tyrosinase copper-binding domain-containing protein n=1 Tax=Truncatella angustata TaxID=152316 RepID=A0A9P8RLL1_9PEZI|nr:uncharacterized protein BKA67DRAFT_113265 [Truncatella angustata]KAH6645475.1 hypothetical protein BKA67DRAFT_113265 [Truncatella angustata]
MCLVKVSYFETGQPRTIWLGCLSDTNNLSPLQRDSHMFHHGILARQYFLGRDHPFVTYAVIRPRSSTFLMNPMFWLHHASVDRIWLIWQTVLDSITADRRYNVPHQNSGAVSRGRHTCFLDKAWPSVSVELLSV